jgi:predicted phosphohydrolase
MFTKSADILIIVGDLGRVEFYENYKTFLSSICSKYKQVYLVAGNHEYYSEKVPLEFLRISLQKLSSEISNLEFLDDTFVDLPGNIRIYGTTLWSQVTSPEASNKILPFQPIDGEAIGTKTWMNREYFQCLYRLEHNISLASKEYKRLIVVSHYAPCFEGCMAPHHAQSSDRFWYANSLEHMLEKSSMYVWIYGHTHINSDRLTIGDTRVVSNQYRANGYDPSKVLRIKHISN